MSKQEEIRNIVAKAISECPIENVGCDGLAQHILNKLHSQGVVIKVDKELPRCMNLERYKALKRAGYVATEPLIAGY